MDAALAVLIGVLFVAATCAVAARLPSRLAWLPILGVGASLFALFLELARFDHGYADLLFVGGLVVAPVVLILSVSLWGSRRFYGWPNLGPHPGRVALLCLAVVAGVLVGTNRKREDVAVSKRTAESLRGRLVAWRSAHDGAWPARLEDAVGEVPVTRLGVLAPPPYDYRPAPEPARLSFPVSSHLRLVLDLDSDTWREERR